MRDYTAGKGNRYYAVIYEGVDPATGKERRRWYSAGFRKGDAEKLVTEPVKRHNDGDYRAPEKNTLGSDLLERRLPGRRAQLRPSTFDSYERNIRLHVLPLMGNVPLQRLTPEELDGLYGQLLFGGRRDGRVGLSHKTVRYIDGILHKAGRRSTQGFGDPQCRRLGQCPEAQLFEEAGDEGLEAARRSVRQAIVCVAYQIKVSDVKTGTGRRTINLDDRTVGVLRTWREGSGCRAHGAVGPPARAGRRGRFRRSSSTQRSEQDPSTGIVSVTDHPLQAAPGRQPTVQRFPGRRPDDAGIHRAGDVEECPLD